MKFSVASPFFFILPIICPLASAHHLGKATFTVEQATGEYDDAMMENPNERELIWFSSDRDVAKYWIVSEMENNVAVPGYKASDMCCLEEAAPTRHVRIVFGNDSALT